MLMDDGVVQLAVGEVVMGVGVVGIGFAVW